MSAGVSRLKVKDVCVAMVFMGAMFSTLSSRTEAQRQVSLRNQELEASASANRELEARLEARRLDEATAATGATGAGTCTWKASPGLRPSGTVTCIIWPFACTAIGWPPTTPSGTFTCIIVGAAGAVETTAAAIGGALSGATGDELTTVPMMTDMAPRELRELRRRVCGGVLGEYPPARARREV